MKRWILKWLGMESRVSRLEAVFDTSSEDLRSDAVKWVDSQLHQMRAYYEDQVKQLELRILSVEAWRNDAYRAANAVLDRAQKMDHRMTTTMERSEEAAKTVKLDYKSAWKNITDQAELVNWLVKRVSKLELGLQRLATKKPKKRSSQT